MSQTSTLKGQCIAEFLGTGLLIFFGVGCVAALKVAGASFGQWEISVIWGLGVAMAIYLTAGVSGAHLNPAVTIALWLFACFDKRKVIPFIVSQVAGAFFTTIYFSTSSRLIILFAAVLKVLIWLALSLLTLILISILCRLSQLRW